MLEMDKGCEEILKRICLRRNINFDCLSQLILGLEQSTKKDTDEVINSILMKQLSDENK